ncbi:MAG: hypothetical protein ABJZ55_24250 [Fuerstiella sp.]
MTGAQDPLERIAAIEQQAAEKTDVRTTREYDIACLDDIVDDHPQLGEPTDASLPTNFTLDSVLRKTLHSSPRAASAPAPHVVDVDNRKSLKRFGYRSVVAMEGKSGQPVGKYKPVTTKQHGANCEFVANRMRRIGEWCETHGVEIDRVLLTVIDGLSGQISAPESAATSEPHNVSIFLHRWRLVEQVRSAGLPAKQAMAELRKTDARFDIGSVFRKVRNEILKAADLIAKPYKGPATLSKSTWLAVNKYRARDFQQSFKNWQLDEVKRLLRDYQALPSTWSEPKLSETDYHSLQSQLCSRVIVQTGDAGTFSIFEFEGAFDWNDQDLELVAIQPRFVRADESPESLLRSIEIESDCQPLKPREVARYRGWRHTRTGQEYNLSEWIEPLSSAGNSTGQSLPTEAAEGSEGAPPDTESELKSTDPEAKDFQDAEENWIDRLWLDANNVVPQRASDRCRSRWISRETAGRESGRKKITVWHYGDVVKVGMKAGRGE